MNGRSFIIKFTAFELGILTGIIMKSDERNQRALKEVWNQLIALKKEIEKETGVTKEMLPGGQLKIRDKDGNVIIREPYPWEVGDN